METEAVAEFEPQVVAPPTTDRNAFAIAAIRRVFALFEVITPRLGGRLAEVIFSSPRKHNPPPFEGEIRERADEAFTVSHAGMELDTLSWGREGDPVVMLVHGWEGRGTQLGRFVDPMVAAGFRVVAFDGPAHGRSPGRRTEVAHFTDAVRDVAAAVGPVHGIIAHSFGGASTMYAAHRGMPVNQIVLVASPSHIGYPIGQFRSIVGIRDKTFAWFKKSFEASMGVPMHEIDMAVFSKDMNIPGLIVHCRDDDDVVFQQGERIHESWPGAELMATQGLGHRRILKDPEVISATVHFLRMQGQSTNHNS